MYWEKEIRFKLTTRRIFSGILAAMSVVNLAIVGTVLGASPPSPSPSATLTAVISPTSTELPTDTLTPFQPPGGETPITVFTGTFTPTSSPTATLTVTPTGTSTVPPTVTACIPPWPYWPVYIVRSGDTLFSIARVTGSNVAELMQANCLTSSRIHPGQRLHVPRLPVDTPTPTGTTTVTPNITYCPPPLYWPVYTIQEKDTLAAIARATDSSVGQLMEANCLPDERVYPGQQLYVPRLPADPPTQTETPTLTSSPTDIIRACIDFEDLKPGSAYNVGNTFVTAGYKISVEPFFWGNGTPTSGGTASVSGQGAAGGSGLDMQTNNVNLNLNDFSYGQPNHLTLLFGAYGGNLNININGYFVNFTSFAEINGKNYGGVIVSVTNSLGTSQGRLELTGAIKSFSIGGQELWIDDVCP